MRCKCSHDARSSQELLCTTVKPLCTIPINKTKATCTLAQQHLQSPSSQHQHYEVQRQHLKQKKSSQPIWTAPTSTTPTSTTQTSKAKVSTTATCRDAHNSALDLRAARVSRRAAAVLEGVSCARAQWDRLLLLRDVVGVSEQEILYKWVLCYWGLSWINLREGCEVVLGLRGILNSTWYWEVRLEQTNSQVGWTWHWWQSVIIFLHSLSSSGKHCLLKRIRVSTFRIRPLYLGQTHEKKWSRA